MPMKKMGNDINVNLTEEERILLVNRFH